MPGRGWYISHDGWNCRAPHWYSARLRCWTRSLTLNGYLLPQSPPASGAQRGSVSGRRGWMELPSGRASQPQSDSQTATAHIPSFKWTVEPRGASGQVRQTQAYWEAARERRMEGRHCSFAQWPALSSISKLQFALLRKQLYHKISNQIGFILILAYYCFLSLHDGSVRCCFWGTGNHKKLQWSLNPSLATGQPSKPPIARHTELQGDT